MFLSFCLSVCFLFVLFLASCVSFLHSLLLFNFDEIVIFCRFLFVFTLLFCLALSYFFLFFVSLLADFQYSVFLYIHVIIFLCFSPFHRVSFVLQRCLMSFFLVVFCISYYLLPVISFFYLSPCFLLLFSQSWIVCFSLPFLCLYLYVVIELYFKLLI